ncbi:MAG: dethiobiotin synthase [Pirellulales bacterium]|nr:dethiobiotin synthase [Pirellulales bacterium]
MIHHPPGLFITGTDTEVGKTYVAAMIAQSLREEGHRVGVYKPAASGCRRVDGRLVADDAVALWEAAGRPGTLEQVCPQCFEAPLAPHLAAEAEGRQLDPELLCSGLEPWRDTSDVILVEGIGGLMCPLGDTLYVADLAADFGFPLIVVSLNVLGTINHTLQTLLAAEHHHPKLLVAGIVLNDPAPRPDDTSRSTNASEIARHVSIPILAEMAWQSRRFVPMPDWYSLAAGSA